MTFWRTLRVLPVAGAFSLILVIVASDTANAQVGGLIRRRAEEAARKVAGEPAPAPPAADAAKPATPNTADNSRPDDNVLAINDTSLAALEKSLETEIALRDEYRKELEAQKAAKEKHEACKGQVPLSSEAQALVERMSTALDGKPEDAQKAMMQMAKDLEALTVKTCGPDPTGTGFASAERLQEIEAKAAAASGPVR